MSPGVPRCVNCGVTKTLITDVLRRSEGGELGVTGKITIRNLCGSHGDGAPKMLIDKGDRP